MDFKTKVNLDMLKTYQYHLFEIYVKFMFVKIIEVKYVCGMHVELRPL